MTTTAVNDTDQNDTRVLGPPPSLPKGTIPLVGQFVCLFRDRVVTAGWLMDEPRKQEPDSVGQVYLDAQMLTADGEVVYAHRTRQEWLDAQRENRHPSAVMLFALHRKRKAELNAVVMAAHEYADDHDLCGEFDDFLDEHGLPSRNDREQYMSVRVGVTVPVTGAGRTEQDAYEDLDREEIFEAMRSVMEHSLQSFDFELD